MIIRSSRVVLPAGVQPADVHVDDGRITAVTEPGTSPIGHRPSPIGHRPSRIVDRPSPIEDVTPLVVMPGLVDTHVHVNEPGRTEWEGFETATMAAAAGGVTTIVDMPLNSVPATTTVDALEQKRAAARDAIHVDVGFWGGVVPDNVKELPALARAGVCGFKCFLAPSGVEEFGFVGKRELRLASRAIARLGAPLLAHAEWPASLLPFAPDGNPRAYATWLDSRPEIAEVRAIAVLVALAREFGTHIHVVHLAAAGALPMLKAARDEQVPVTVETCPHYLTFRAEEIGDGSTLFKCAPPIREGSHREALWQALRDGAVDLIATDHSSCPPSLKDGGDFLQAWGGIASLELSLAVVWTAASVRGIELSRLAEWLCAAPARLAGLAARKGTIAPGKDADLVIWDPDAAFVVDPERLHQRHKQTPYAGRTLRGRVAETYVRGRLVYRDGARGAAPAPHAGELLTRIA